MSAFTPADIPANINTYERLNAWSSIVLGTLNPQASTLEVDNQNPIRNAQFQIVKSADGTHRLVMRNSLELDPTYAYDSTTKLWIKIKEISVVAVPAAFKS